MSLIRARPHAFMEIDHEIQCMFYCHSPQSTDSRRVGVSYKQKYVHLVLRKLPGKSVVRLIDCLDMTIAVDWDVKLQTKTVCKGYQHTTKDVCGSALAVF